MSSSKPTGLSPGPMPLGIRASLRAFWRDTRVRSMTPCLLGLPDSGHQQWPAHLDWTEELTSLSLLMPADHSALSQRPALGSTVGVGRQTALRRGWGRRMWGNSALALSTRFWGQALSLPDTSWKCSSILAIVEVTRIECIKTVRAHMHRFPQQMLFGLQCISHWWW